MSGQVFIEDVGSIDDGTVALIVWQDRNHCRLLYTPTPSGDPHGPEQEDMPLTVKRERKSLEV